MGHTVALQCPACRGTHEVDLKNVDLNLSAAAFSYEFVCDCGYSHSFVETPMRELEDWTPHVSESTRVAESFGISAESHASLIWPTDVRSAIDLDRRALPDSQIKRELRVAALPTPKPFDDRWWIVYKSLQTIVFDPHLKIYGVIDAAGVVIEVGDINAVCVKLESKPHSIGGE